MARLRWDRTKKQTKTTSLSGDRQRLNGDAASAWLRENDRDLNQVARRTHMAAKPKKRARSIANMASDSHDYVIFTDGACEPNPGVGGWGFVVYFCGDEIHTDFGGSAQSTNNIMELTAMLRAIEWASANTSGAKIYTDSTYVEQGCNQWRFGWRKNDWRKSAKGGAHPVKNAEIWRDLDLALRGAGVIIAWCKGHAGTTGNERADQLASIGRLCK